MIRNAQAGAGLGSRIAGEAQCADRDLADVAACFGCVRGLGVMRTDVTFYAAPGSRVEAKRRARRISHQSSVRESRRSE